MIDTLEIREMTAKDFTKARKNPYVEKYYIKITFAALVFMI